MKFDEVHYGDKSHTAVKCPAPINYSRSFSSNNTAADGSDVSQVSSALESCSFNSKTSSTLLNFLIDRATKSLPLASDFYSFLTVENLVFQEQDKSDGNGHAIYQYAIGRFVGRSKSLFEPIF